jgi:type IV fimbrial biogenesis protein FimT
MKYQTRKPIASKTQDGFTIIELMMTLAIAAVILTQAVPSFTGMIANNRLITQTNDLVADVNLARSEAVARGVRVVLCNSADSRVAGATCNGTAQTWTTGWLMYADDDASGAYEIANDTLIRIGQPSHSTITVMANAAGNTDLQYNSDGTANEAGNTVIFAICDENGATNGRQINVNGVGRPRLISTSIASCTP